MRKLANFTFGFAIATAIGLYFLQGQWYFLACGVASALLGAGIYFTNKFGKLRFLPLILLGCTIGFLWMTLFEFYYLSIPRAADEKHVDITITATDYSYESSFGSIVDGTGVLNGKLYRITVFLPEEMDVKPGDALTGRFTLQSTLPGGSGEYSNGYSKGIFLSAKISRLPEITNAEKLPWYGYPAYVRNALSSIVDSIFPSNASGFAVALLLGDTSKLDFETYYSMKVSGISHIVAVSGLHVTILFALIYRLLGKKRLLSACIGLPLLFFFAAVVGFSPSITRACIMHALMILAMLFEKDYDPLTALAFAIQIMLSINPWTVTNVSFQLSVFCMLGILFLAEPIKTWILNRRYIRSVKGKYKKYIGVFASSVGMSIGATAFVTPLCAYYFGMVSLIGVVTNLLTLWVVSFTFYGVIAATLLGFLYQPMGGIIAQIVSFPVAYIIGVSNILSDFPLAAVYTDSVYIVCWLVFVYVLLLIFILSKQKRPIIMFCCAVMGLCTALFASWIEPQTDACRVTVLDVGQGQCILLQSEGKTFVVDCGGSNEAQSATIAINALKSQGVQQIDGLILTHFDQDHAGGVANLLTTVEVDMLYIPDCVDSFELIPGILAKHTGELLYIQSLTEIKYGNTKITLIPSTMDLSDNEAGLCILFQTENCDILITGDRSAAGERDLMHQIQLPELEVLIIGHHGSKHSSSNMLLETARPKIAIISVGADNPYGHPSKETLERLLTIGSVIYRTDLHGSVTYRG